MTATATKSNGGTKTKLRNPRMLQSTLGRINRQMGLSLGKIEAEFAKFKALAHDLLELEGELTAWTEANANGGKPAGGTKGGSPPG